MSPEEQRKRDIFMRSRQAQQPAPRASPAPQQQRPAVRRTIPAPQRAPQSQPPSSRPPQQQQRPQPQRPQYGYRGTAQPTRASQRPVQPPRPIKLEDRSPSRPPVSRSTPPRPQPQQRPPAAPPRQTQAPRAPAPRYTPPAAPAAPRTKFLDKVREVAKNTKTKLENLPRTEQSRSIFPRPQERPETTTYEVSRTASRAQADAARLTPTRTVGPSASDLRRKPASSKPTPTRSVAKSTSKKTAPKKSPPKPKPAPKLEIDPIHDFDDLESLANAAVPKVTTSLDNDDLKLPPAPAEAEAIVAANPILLTPTEPAAPEPPSIIGDSIFRSLIEQATAAALIHGSTALGMTIVEDSTSAPGTSAIAKSETPVVTETEKPAEPKLAPTVADVEKMVAAASSSDDGRIDAALRDAVKLAARMADGRDVSADGAGLSVEKVLDLTQTDDDLPFIEHRPPSRDAGAGVGDMVISAVNQTDFDIDSSQMEFSGNVQVKSPRFALRSDRFIVHLKSDGSGMAYGEAIGNVYIRMQENGKPSGHEGFASKAIYRPDDGKLTLSGWPKIREKQKEHVAATKSTQMVLYTDGRVKTLGRNRTVIRK